jgi:hypothetical protein
LTAPVEVLFVTTRATELPAALERVPPALLTASTSPYAQAEVCAAALTLRLGASFCHSPGELSATISRVGRVRRILRRGYLWLLRSGPRFTATMRWR